MIKSIGSIIDNLISSTHGREPISGQDISSQFNPQDLGPVALARNLNAAFLLGLTSNQESNNAREYIGAMAKRPEAAALAHFFQNGFSWLESELDKAANQDPGLVPTIEQAAKTLGNPTGGPAVESVWEVFFPEGLSLLDNREAAVSQLRQRRKIKVLRPNPEPVTNPAAEVLFTSNILLGKPAGVLDSAASGLSQDLVDRISNWEPGQQRYWYDHPTPLGIVLDQNEILHGLCGLSQAVAYEQSRQAKTGQEPLTCICSVSVTHDSLHDLAHDYIDQTLRNAAGLKNLDIYLFTERDTDRLKKEVLFPAAKHYFPRASLDSLDRVIGVDGEYGRHFSFLKAVAAFWQVLIKPEIKATFKIDLDQVFPQHELTSQAGASAFELLADPLWGAVGADHWGQEVELGMIAGALVNHSDISKGIFTPDVPWPEGLPKADQTVFFSSLPQALSTEAEMMTRYGRTDLDGHDACIQRIHVSGGMTGILVNSLRRCRPFTPTFIGRAEDQAYVLATLFSRPPWLRCLHKPGLIMRHDKEDLIPETIASSKVSKTIGDYLRILLFSDYCQALPWPQERIKQTADPFTGCFISSLPLHVVFLRLALKAAALFAVNKPENTLEACQLLHEGASRLGQMITRRGEYPQEIVDELGKQREGWDLYYDLLQRLEQGLTQNGDFELAIKQKAEDLADSLRADTNPGIS